MSCATALPEFNRPIWRKTSAAGDILIKDVFTIRIIDWLMAIIADLTLLRFLTSHLVPKGSPKRHTETLMSHLSEPYITQSSASSVIFLSCWTNILHIAITRPDRSQYSLQSSYVVTSLRWRANRAVKYGYTSSVFILTEDQAPRQPRWDQPQPYSSQSQLPHPLSYSSILLYLVRAEFALFVQRRHAWLAGDIRLELVALKEWINTATFKVKTGCSYRSAAWSDNQQASLDKNNAFCRS